MSHWKKYLAELLGTFLLVFIGAGAGLAAQQTGSSELTGVALAHGIALMIIVYVFGPISGAHVNPAVTAGLWVTKKIHSVDAALYILVQCAGAALAALALKVIYAGLFTSGLGAPALGPGVSWVPGVITEAILTFFLVWTIFAVAVDQKDSRSYSGLAIGLVLTMDILMGGALTGGAMNPARWLGPALVSSTWDNWYVYVAGPLLGGILAAALYQGVYLAKGKE